MPSLQSSFKDVRTLVGARGGLLYAANRLLQKATRGRCRLVHYRFVAQPVPAATGQTRTARSTTRIYRASPGDAIIAEFPRPPDVVARRFADGAVCFVAERAGKFAGFLWIKERTYCEDEVRCRYVLSPAERLVWDFDVFVAPEFRMSRAFAQLWEGAHAFLRERGYTWTISRIAAFNAASLASHARLGMVPAGTGLFVVAGPAQLAAFSRRPYLHFGLGANRAPTLEFRSPETVRTT